MKAATLSGRLLQTLTQKSTLYRFRDEVMAQTTRDNEYISQLSIVNGLLLDSVSHAAVDVPTGAGWSTATPRNRSYFDQECTVRFIADDLARAQPSAVDAQRYTAYRVASPSRCMRSEYCPSGRSDRLFVFQ